MTDSLKTQLSASMKAAMKSREKDKLTVIRGIQAAIKQIEIDEQCSIDDDEQIIAIIDKLGKQRRESIKQFDDAGRTDLSEKERFELGILQEFLPKPLDETELAALIDAAIEETAASSMQDMGKVMAIIKSQAQGRADMAAVSKQIKQRLS